MPQSLSSIYLHLVFSTKNRSPYLRDDDLRDETHRYLGGVSHGMKCQPLIVGGTEDHVHVLSMLHRTVAPSDLVKQLKGASSNWLTDKGFASFAWQNGYGAFSVSAREIPMVRHYIENQAEHHLTEPFEKEFLAMLVEHNLSWDDRYVFD